MVPLCPHIIVDLYTHKKKNSVKREENVWKPLSQKSNKNESLQKCPIMLVSFYLQDMILLASSLNVSQD